MYFYNIGYSTCEESYYRQVSHNDRFTHKQLQAMITKCLLTAVKPVAKPHSKYAHQRHPSFEDLMGSEELFWHEMFALGFSPVSFEEEVSVFGWASPLGGKDNWENHSGDTTKQIVKDIKRAYATWRKGRKCTKK